VKNRVIIAALVAAVLASAFPTAAQQRRRPVTPARPAQAKEEAAPAAETPAVPAARRAVTVTLKDGSTVAGDYAGADLNAVFVTVAGNRLTLKLDDVSAVYFGAPPAAAPAAAAPPRQSTTLLIEAGIIYKMGGNQPVARTEFMLLDQSLEAVLREGGVSEGRTGVLSTYAFAVKYPEQFPGVAAAAQRAIKAHLVSSVSTDFAGKAQFTDLKPGSYYLAGLSSTRKGFAIWNVPIEVKAGQNSLFLDQNNAATAF
jgi:hypothetical protein